MSQLGALCKKIGSERNLRSRIMTRFALTFASRVEPTKVSGSTESAREVSKGESDSNFEQDKFIFIEID